MNKQPRILIIKTSSMGDILHTLPALSDAANILPNATFDWVVEEVFSDIPHWHPHISNVIPVALRRWRKSWWRTTTRREYQQFKLSLRANHYDYIIDAQGLLKSAALIATHCLGETHGYDWSSAREPLATLFYTKKHHVAVNLHAIERTRQLFAKTLDYAIPAHPGEYQIQHTFTPLIITDSIPYWVFLHATTRADKHWPESYWQQLIESLSSSGINIKLPWNNLSEKERAIRLAAQHQHVTVLEHHSLTELAKLLNRAQGVISVDTGLSHLTAALGRPNITLFGPTDPALVGGYGKQQYTIRATHGQMSDITPEIVLQKMYSITENPRITKQ